MSFRRIRAMARKEFLHILRDPLSLIMALAIPVLLLMLFGLALSLDVDRIPTYVHDASQTPESRELIARIRGSRYLEIRGESAGGLQEGYRELDRLIDRNRVLVGFMIPPDFGRDLSSGRSANVQIVIDGSDSNTASIAMGYAETVVRNYSLQVRQKGQDRRAGGADHLTSVPVDTRMRVWYNSELKSRNYIVPGLTAVILMIIAALLTSMTIAREWEMGTMEQLLSTPLRPSEMVLGKMAAFFAVGVADAVIAMVVGIAVFRVPMRGDPLVLILSTCIFLFGALFWGIFLSAVARNQLLAFQMGLLSSFLPSFLLSGFIYAIEGMPGPIRVFTHIVPARYFVTILKGVFLKGVGLGVLWGELVFLTLFALIVFALATRRLRQKMA